MCVCVSKKFTVTNLSKNKREIRQSQKIPSNFKIIELRF